MALQLEAKLNDTDAVINNVKNELKDQVSVLRVRQLHNNLEQIRCTTYLEIRQDSSDDSDR